MELSRHNIILTGPSIALRPMTERDWDPLLRWNNDPDVLYFTEGDDITSRTLEEVQAIYRSVSQQAFCFTIEFQDQPIGDAWLQRMNLPRILDRYPDADCRRIDLMIGEKSLWGHGLGGDVIRLLTNFAFDHEHADLVFAVDIAGDNPRSQKAFQKVGYELIGEIPQPSGSKAQSTLDFALSRQRFNVLRAQRP